MQKIQYLLLILIVTLVSGCSWAASWARWPLMGQPRQASVLSSSRLESMPARKPVPGLMKRARVLEPSRLEAGGKVLVVPFKPGQGIEAANLLDRVALRIVKGIAEGLLSSAEITADAWDGNTGRFTPLLQTEHAAEATFVLEGHVTLMKHSAARWRWIGLRLKVQLAFEGKLIDTSTRRVVAVFSDERLVTQKKRALLTPEERLKALAHVMGRDVARFLLLGANKGPQT